MQAILTKAACLFLAGLLALPVAGQARQPLSASDWLSGSLETPDFSSGWRPGDAVAPPTRGSDLAKSGSVDPVAVTRLDQVNPDVTGTISARAAGLPADLWGDSDSATLAQAVQGHNPRLPALRRLMRRILAARLDPPAASPSPAVSGALFLARVDKLLDMGATGAAQELLLAAGDGDPQHFRRLFDIALLSGDEARACLTMDHTPGIAPSFAARIFCLALGGDWAAAAIVYMGADKLGRIDDDTAVLMTHYLDDGFSESSDPLPVPSMVTPLTFRLYEAVGQPLPTNDLPLAFSLSDLDGNGGWKAQLDAAERLARVAAIPASQLRQIYNQQKPAASGGVWDRAIAMQRLDRALASGDPDAVRDALPKAFDIMNSAGLGYALADIAGADTAMLELDDDAGVIAIRLALAANQIQTIEVLPAKASVFDRWLVSFASGEPRSPLPAEDPQGIAAVLAPAFQGNPQTALPQQAANLISGNRKGEALLAALADVDAGVDSDLVRAAGGLRVLRALGQGDIARQAAVELMLGTLVSGLR